MERGSNGVLIAVLVFDWMAASFLDTFVRMSIFVKEAFGLMEEPSLSFDYLRKLLEVVVLILVLVLDWLAAASMEMEGQPTQLDFDLHQRSLWTIIISLCSRFF
ncbi:hypothetical protein MLD38_034919 [Melastoma candidum]|uniref:Uncharacterized protein n=1 Tax=Melastoma candidum TaxID=119954 RepID=A0ACB9MD93_9MYRT|nr:hypothetical protein MLD38_034919 [Melastoma candidum]